MHCAGADYGSSSSSISIFVEASTLLPACAACLRCLPGIVHRSSFARRGQADTNKSALPAACCLPCAAPDAPREQEGSRGCSLGGGCGMCCK